MHRSLPALQPVRHQTRMSARTQSQPPARQPSGLRAARLSPDVALATVLAAVLLMTACEGERRPLGSIPSDLSDFLGDPQTQQGAGSSDAGPAGQTTPGSGGGMPGSRPGGAERPGPAMDAQGRLVVADFAWATPAGWIPRSPTTPFADWEYELPGPGGPALVTLGLTGGTVAENVGRWQGQLGPQRTAERQEELTSEALTVPVPWYEGTGTFRGTSNTIIAGAFLPRLHRPGTPAFTYVKVTGPATTVQMHLPALRSFVRAAQPVASDVPSEGPR